MSWRVFRRSRFVSRPAVGSRFSGCLVGLIGALVVGTSGVSQTAWDPQAWASTAPQRSPLSLYVQENGEWLVWENGKPLDGERLKKREGKLHVLNEKGKTAYAWTLTEDGKVVAPEGSVVSSYGRFWSASQPKATIGIDLGGVDDVLASHLGVKSDGAILVTAVHEGRAAEKAGVKKYDVIVGIGDEDGATPKKLREALAETDQGDVLTLELVRRGERLVVSVPVETESRAAAYFPGAGGFQTYGDALGRYWQLENSAPGTYRFLPKYFSYDPSNRHTGWVYGYSPQNPVSTKKDPVGGDSSELSDGEIEGVLNDLELKIAELRRLLERRNSKDSRGKIDH